LRDGETVADMFIGKHGTGQIAYDLMHFDHDLPGAFRVKGDRLDVGIDLAPLLCPLSADFLRPTNKTVFERFRPGDVGRHQSQGGIDVTRVESRIRCAEELDVWCRLIGHLEFAT
jgi:hypothetical protein